MLYFLFILLYRGGHYRLNYIKNAYCPRQYAFKLFDNTIYSFLCYWFCRVYNPLILRKNQPVSANAQWELSEIHVHIVNTLSDLCEAASLSRSDSYPYPLVNPLAFENTQNMHLFFVQSADFVNSTYRYY